MKRGHLMTGIVYVAVGILLLALSSLTEGRLGSLLFAFGFAGAVPGAVMIGKYVYWTSPRNRERYAERVEQERIDLHDERKIMLVDDEIQMGFYRTGKLWGLQNFGITPDVVVFGKAMTNGLNPLAGIWAKERYINPQVFPCGSTHSTFASNPLGTAVALETMRMLAEEDYEARVREMGAYFLEGLRELKSRYAIIGDVDGLGLALRAEICAADGFTPDKAMMDRIVDEGIKGDLMVDGKRYGLVLDVGGYYKNVITLAPSLNITREEVDLAMRLLDEILRRVTKN